VDAERYLWAKLLVQTRARTPRIRRRVRRASELPPISEGEEGGEERGEEEGEEAGEGEAEGEEGGEGEEEAKRAGEGQEAGEDAGAGPFLCPVAELASHLSLGPTASLELEGGELVLRG